MKYGALIELVFAITLYIGLAVSAKSGFLGENEGKKYQTSTKISRVKNEVVLLLLAWL